MTVAVVIPAHNEAATIADIVRRACAQLDYVIVVDDGSIDGTGEQLVGLPVVVLRNEHNLGKAASLWRGMSAALEGGARAVLTLDGDGQHCPEDIPRLLDMARHCPESIVVAARLGRRDAAPGLRRFGNKMADFWISWAAGYPIRDTQSGFRLYPASLLQRIAIRHDQRSGFVFESEILIEAARLGYYATPVAIDSIYNQTARPSYYRPGWDTVMIVRMVAWKLISRGLYIPGLLRSLGWGAPPRSAVKKNNLPKSGPNDIF